MCLAIPGRIVSIDENHEGSVPALVAYGLGEPKRVDLVMLADVAVGDYVIVHSGFAISRVSAEQADEVIGLLNSVSTDSDFVD